jgi:ubiquinone/menaquinone biosynthesis C-methylase UbiE
MLTDPVTTRAHYETEEHLETRRSVWHPSADGLDPSTEALAAIVSRSDQLAEPLQVLEVGCGTGAFGARISAELPGARIVATDQSERFVEITAGRGVPARVADVQQLPFDDDEFDVVAAMWMLYHVPDLERGLTEVRRVLRPGGLFVAVTNGDEHTADLRRAAGGSALVTQFSSENGEESLRRHFDDVRRQDIATRAVFADHATATAYLASLEDGFDWRLPEFSGPRTYTGGTTVFCCD